jgi:hypothetical protein
MSKTISFVASDELADFLSEESERRMTTVSSTAQMLLAEKARETGGVGGGAETAKPASEPSEDDVFDRHPDAWYHPNSQKHDYAVHVPESSGVHDAGKKRYYKTRSGAGKALNRWYE